MDRVGGQGNSALTVQISQAGWTDVIHLSTIRTCSDGCVDVSFSFGVLLGWVRDVSRLRVRH